MAVSQPLGDTERAYARPAPGLVVELKPANI